MKWLAHAFAVEPDGPAEPTDAQRAVVQRVAHAIVRRRMATPALMLLEMARPLSYVGAQTMHFFAPVLTALVDREGYRHLAAFLERRGAVDYLCRQIEALEAQQEAHQEAHQEAQQEAHQEAEEDAPDRP